ncbi:MAG: hypothetical protein UY21_C0031G0002 [Microgenomates group bacterium GW2011_GWA1_48_10]|nr:MAG: hypothetical protein UY21_C0031G0002 [Microgenomates group bacterium GW2011_GWA1_48_10]
MEILPVVGFLVKTRMRLVSALRPVALSWRRVCWVTINRVAPRRGRRRRTRVRLRVAAPFFMGIVIVFRLLLPQGLSRVQD